MLKQGTILLAIFLLSLTACGETASNACAHLTRKHYSAAFSNKLADEIDRAPVGAAYPQAVLDYKSTLNEIDACKGR